MSPRSLKKRLEHLRGYSRTPEAREALSKPHHYVT
jgi:hypothetical protein